MADEGYQSIPMRGDLKLKLERTLQLDQSHTSWPFHGINITSANRSHGDLTVTLSPILVSVVTLVWDLRKTCNLFCVQGQPSMLIDNNVSHLIPSVEGV